MRETTSSLDFDLTDLQLLGPQLDERLAAIREHEAVFWSDIQQGWFVTRFADVAEGFGGKLPLSTARLGKMAFASIPEHEWQSRIPLLTTATPTWVNMTDPPHHARLRKPMTNAFSKSNVETMRAFVLARLQQLFETAERRREIEFIEEIARPLTGSVIMKLMGVPEEHLANLRDWANSIVMALGSPHPNPFAGSTRLALSLPTAAHALVEVFEISGRRVRTLSNGPMPAGSHSLQWDGHDSRGAMAPSGVYLFRATVGSRTTTRRGVHLR